MMTFLLRSDTDAPARPSGWIARLGVAFHEAPGNVRGAIWITLAGIFFTAMSALIKLLGERIAVAEILFFRQLVMTVLLVPLVIRQRTNPFRTPYFKMHMARVALATIAMSAGFTALVHLPLADATALGFSKAFFTVVFAIIILGEKVGPHRWLSTALGFAGVIIMLRPTGDAFNIYGLLSIISAAAAAMIMIIIRKLAQKEPLITIMAYQSVVLGLVMAIPTFFVWVTPNWHDVILLILVGITSSIAQSLNIRAYRAGEAASVASMDYLRLLHAAVIGFLLFSEVPASHTLIGAALIVVASLYAIHRERKAAAPEIQP
jgi:drug/metabolite transporter (DMT)-like permease